MFRRAGVFCVGGLLGLLSGGLHAQSVTVGAIDTTNRVAVTSAYTSIYVPNRAVAPAWTGNTAACNAGTTAAGYSAAAIQNVNFYRALVGLPNVNWIQDTNVVTRARDAALIEAANKGALPDAHHPPTTATCYTAAGASGANSSNLTIGGGYGTDFSTSFTGAHAVDLYMDDSGANNVGILGHRRWLIYQSEVGIGVGDIADPSPGSATAPTYSSNLLRVMPPNPLATGDTLGAEATSLYWQAPATNTWAAWPSPNFLPYTLLPANSQLWSLSYPGANFSAATVTISTAAGTNVPVSAVVALPSGYGDNALQFQPTGGITGSAGMADTSYKVQVSGITGAGSATSYCYTVTVFDPANTAGQATAPDLCSPTTTKSQTITFSTANPSPVSVTGTYIPVAIATSGLTVTFTIDAGSTSVCHIATGNVVTFDAAGTCVIDANQSGGTVGATTYSAAAQVQQSISVGKLNQTISSTATPSSLVAGGTYTASATASSGLPVTVSVSGNCSINTVTNLVTFTSAGSCTVNFAQAGDGTYNPATLSQTFAIAALTQTITFLPQATTATTVGASFPLSPAATTSSGLAVTYSSTTPTICKIVGTTVTALAQGNCTIAANQAGNASYAAAPTVTQNFAIGLNSQVIAFTSTAPASPIVGSTYLVSATTVSGGATPIAYSIDSTTVGVCSISGTTVTFNTTGTCLIDANKAGDGVTYANASQVQQSITVAPKTAQTITFGAQSTVTHAVGGGSFALSPTASSDSSLAVTYSSQTPAVCTISGTTVTPVAAGTCTIAANQAGNATFAAAPTVTQNIAIGVGSQTITFTSTPPASPTVNGTYTVSANGGASGNPVTFTIDTNSTPGACTITGSTVKFVTSGQCIIDANQAGSTGTYAAATQVQQTINIAGLTQTITFNAQTTASRNAGTTFALSPIASASSGLAVSYSASPASVCTISGTTVTALAQGSCQITASQAGNATFAAATPVSQTIAIGLAPQTVTITSTNPVNATVGDTYTLAATSTGGSNPVTFSVAGACSLTGSTVTFTGAGTCTINADKAGDGATYAAASQARQTVTVALKAQSITFGPQTPASHPTLVVGGTFALSPVASASSGLAVTYGTTTPTICSITGTTVTMAAVGGCVITADQAGDTTYAPAAQQRQTIALGLAAQVISFTFAPASPTAGDSYTLSASGGASGNPVTFSVDAASDAGACAITGTTLRLTGAGTCVVDANQAGNSTTFADASQVQTLIVVAPRVNPPGVATVPTLDRRALWLLAALVAALALGFGLSPARRKR